MAAAEAASGAELWIWRHPLAVGAEGRCIGGGSDLALDARRARRLARRIAQRARREGLPRVVWTSPLRRCADVGRLLRRRHGFVHRIDARLVELDFGGWDGRPWSAITRAEVARWESDFLHHAPGGGESLAALIARVRGFLAERCDDGPALLIVGHAGWINALASLAQAAPPTAATWPRAVRHGALSRRSVPR